MAQIDIEQFKSKYTQELGFATRMRWPGLRPEEVTYTLSHNSTNIGGLVIRGEFFPYVYPRLAYADILEEIHRINGSGYIRGAVYWDYPEFHERTFGGAGFGYERRPDGTLVRITHFGNVVIGNEVEIGEFTCIDRAVIGSTVIGDGTKIDNLVHIAHGAKIGKHCLIVAGAVIGGSAEIGDYSYIGMGALIKNKIKVGSRVTVGMGAVVTKDVPDGWTVIGNPARKYEKA